MQPSLGPSHINVKVNVSDMAMLTACSRSFARIGKTVLGAGSEPSRLRPQSVFQNDTLHLRNSTTQTDQALKALKALDAPEASKHQGLKVEELSSKNCSLGAGIAL